MSNNLDVPKPYLSLNLKLLQLGGINHPETENLIIRAWFQFYKFFVVIIIILGYTVVELIGKPSTTNHDNLRKNVIAFVGMARHLDDIGVFTKLMGFALSHLMGCVKIWIWFTKRNQIDKIIQLVESGDEFQHRNIDRFQTNSLTRAVIRISRFVTWTDFVLGTALPINASIIAWQTPVVSYYVENRNTTLQLRKLPYDTWYPLEALTMPYYPIAFFYQVFAIFIFATDITTLDTLYVGLIMHVTNQINVLKLALVSLRDRLDYPSMKLFDSEEDEIQMKGLLRKCIIHHQTIIETTGSLDKIIRFLLLGQFFASTFILVTSLFSLSINKVGSMSFVNEVSYLMAVLFQLFVYCWFGNGITHESSNLNQAIFECNWLPSSTGLKRSLLIMMSRTRRPLKLNIGIFAPLTLQTYVTVLRGSYSYFAVLKQMDLEEKPN